MEQSYEIMECGTKAKTINTLGKTRPNFLKSNPREVDMWDASEAMRVTYEIEPKFIRTFDSHNLGAMGDVLEEYTPGTIVQGQIINGKLHITKTPAAI